MSDQVNKNWRWIFPSFITIAMVVAFFIGKEGFSGQSNNEPIVPEEQEEYAIFPIELPKELDFAGELVPLKQFDVLEALDREILSNAFFHSQTIRLIKMANRYFPIIEPILKAEGIPDDFKYLAVAENGEKWKIKFSS